VSSSSINYSNVVHRLTAKGRNVYQEIELKTERAKKEKIEEKEDQPSKDSIELNKLARILLNKCVSMEETTGHYLTVKNVKGRYGDSPLFADAIYQLEIQGLWEVIAQMDPDSHYYKATDKGKSIFQ